MISERISQLQVLSKKRGKVPILRPHFMRDYHGAALGIYKDLPHWEKLARSMAYAVVNQPIYAYHEDRIGGRIYYDRELPILEECPELDYKTEAHSRFLTARRCWSCSLSPATPPDIFAGSMIGFSAMEWKVCVKSSRRRWSVPGMRRHRSFTEA